MVEGGEAAPTEETLVKITSGDNPSKKGTNYFIECADSQEEQPMLVEGEGYWSRISTVDGPL